MIADLKTFIDRERPYWEELERELGRIRDRFADMSDLKYARHVLSLFQRASSDLARIQGWSAEPELKAYLETLVGTGYAEIHTATRNSRHFRPWHWLTRSFPQAFRRQIWGWHVSVLITIAGGILGALLIAMDVEGGREAIFPFAHLVKMTPSQRVAWEESRQLKAQAKGQDTMEGAKASFAGSLMSHNIQVSIFAMALGLTWGLGTVLVLFYNGAALFGVALDYMMDGQSTFMFAWLLPHGSVEIPAILIGGQAGLVLGRALIGWGTPDGLRTRFRKTAPDLAHLAGGMAVLLVWAGIIESFFSQYHAPILPYSVKITFGTLQLAGLGWFLFFCGRDKTEAKA
jgi:uncharacterized membrane protein SpoIIM required for sporulation